MSFILSPSMSLPIPGVGTESGPQFAYDVNSSLTLIDAHDHSPGKGVLITPSGLNINAALSFNGFSATNLGLVAFQALGSATSTVQALSVAPAGSIDELWYTDNNGTLTQITANGQVNAIAAAIPGESYSGGTFIWTQTQSSLPTTPANFDIGSIILRPNTAGTTNGVTLSPPSSISSAYTINLPQLPVATGVTTISSTGTMSTVVGTAGTHLVGGSAPVFVRTTPTVQVFTSGAGTYTTPTSPSPAYLEIIAIGGGGGGGASAASPGTAGNGNATSFGGSLIQAGGGARGTSGNGSAPGAGGDGGTASVSGPTQLEAISGGQGTTPTNIAAGTSALNMPAGQGGNSARGGAGRGGVNSNGNTGGDGAVNSGAGGGGGAGSPSYPGGGGGAGSYIYAIINSPTTTYTYVVGAGGIGGTGTGPGGHGGSGVIIVKEYY